MQNAWNEIKSAGLNIAESLTPVLKTSKFRETVNIFLFCFALSIAGFVLGRFNTRRVCGRW